MQRIIAHIDMNCFYASVEEKYDPSLKGKPLAIAGEIKTRHGIIVTSNYEARKLGIKTTMRVGEAKKLCPTLKIMRPDFNKYQNESKRIFDLVREYTECIEIVSIDEAYIDLTELVEPIKTMAIIQRRIYKELNIPSSVGLSYNKFFAKMASDMKKPLGFTIINSKNYKDLLWGLDVGEMHGCGKVATKKLKKIGINTIGAIASANDVILNSILGIQGLRLKNRANGEDNRKLSYTVERKSIGNSKTFVNDLEDEDEILKEINNIIEKVNERAVAKEYVGNNISIMLKFDDFKIMTRSKKINFYTNEKEKISEYAWQLIIDNYDFSKKIRLIGVSLNDVKKISDISIQLDIFNKIEDSKELRLKKVMKEIKDKYGDKRKESKSNTIITTSFSKDFLD